MEHLTSSTLYRLRLLISLRILHSNDEIRKIYREIAKAQTEGMMLEAIRKLPEGEIQYIKETLEPKEKIIPKPQEHFKQGVPLLSFKFFDGKDYKRKQRLEVLERIRKSKLK